VSPLQHAAVGPVFPGDVDDETDLLAAAAMAAACAAFSVDDEDECYVDSDAPSCFNCRGRRWVPQGFTFVRRVPRG